MTGIKNKQTQKEKMVERMGIFFEKGGLTPMPGRVFAYLLLAEPPYKDFYEIQEFLKASKSAISNALKYLMNQNMVEYITFSGDRRRYFKVNMEGWISLTKKQLLSVTTLKDIVSDVLEARSETQHIEFNAKLKKMITFHTELAIVLDQFVEKWEREHK